MGKNPPIRAILAPVGYTPAEHAHGRELLQRASGYSHDEASGHQGESEADAATGQLNGWEAREFITVEATLRHRHPDQHRFVFDGVESSHGNASVLVVSRVLDRLDALDEGDERKATRADDHAALAALSVRGIDPASRKHLRDLVKQASAYEPVDPTPAARAEAERRVHREALLLLRAWYEERSTIAHAHITRKEYLIRLGLAQRKKSKKDVKGEGAGGSGQELERSAERLEGSEAPQAPRKRGVVLGGDHARRPGRDAPRATATDGGRRSALAGRRTADGGRRMAAGGWRMADGGRRTADVGRRTADGGRRTAVGERRTADGGRRTASSSRRTANGGRRSPVGERRPAVGGRRSADGSSRGLRASSHPRTTPRLRGAWGASLPSSRSAERSGAPGVGEGKRPRAPGAVRELPEQPARPPGRPRELPERMASLRSHVPEAPICSGSSPAARKGPDGRLRKPCQRSRGELARSGGRPACSGGRVRTLPTDGGSA